MNLLLFHSRSFLCSGSTATRPILAFVSLAATFLAFPPAQAQEFQVYCINSGDGTTTCSGWDGGETLTCVNDAGGVSSCSTPSGRSFICVLDSGGVASCSRGQGVSDFDKSHVGGTDCTFTGDGNFTCSPPQRKQPALLSPPTLTQPVVIDEPPMINPDVDFNLIQPLNP